MSNGIAKIWAEGCTKKHGPEILAQNSSPNSAPQIDNDGWIQNSAAKILAEDESQTGRWKC